MNGSRNGAARLFVVVGLPGSGKTTLATSLAQRHGAVRLNPDEWITALGVDLFDEPFRDLLEQQLTRLAAGLLTAGSRVIVEFGSWSRIERDHLLEVGRKAGVAVEMHVLDPSTETLWARLARRNDEPGQVRIDRAMLDTYLASWHPPDAAELARYDRPDA